jgi:uncharacterized protein (DUF362 family)
MPSSSDPTPGWSRRTLITAAAGAAIGGAAVGAARLRDVLAQPLARVVTIAASSYEADLVDRLRRGIAEFPEFVRRVRGANVLLKPNLVEFHADRPVNTDPRVIAAAAEAFRSLGAATVRVGEGPGHRRDTERMVDQSGLGDALRAVGGVPFIDLNVDVPEDLPLLGGQTGLVTLPIARSVLAADLVVSCAKLKTHHWAGVTLSMKNLFGTVSGQRVGWPKNPLHHAGIENSILDLWSSVRPAFAIIDGIVGMEGDGPIMGTAAPLGALILGEALPAVDATSARLIGLDPERIAYLARAPGLGGTIHERRIEVVGDRIAVRPFAVLPNFEHLRR